MVAIGFVGLGVMGFPMAGHLQRAGHAVTVYNRTASKAQAWVDTHGGVSADTPGQAMTGADIGIAMVGDDDDVRSVVSGDSGMLAGLEAGAVLVDHTTASASLAQELAAVCETVGVGFVDAPVSGGQTGAENGKLTVMCGAEQSDFDQVSAVLETYAVAVTRLGPAGAGQLTKMVNRGSTMARNEFDFDFAVDWMRKDLGIALQQGKELGASLPVAALVDQRYAQVQARGGGRWDTSALIDLLRNP